MNVAEIVSIVTLVVVLVRAFQGVGTKKEMERVADALETRSGKITDLLGQKIDDVSAAVSEGHRLLGEKLSRIEIQTTKTNGNVSALQDKSREHSQEILILREKASKPVTRRK